MPQWLPFAEYLGYAWTYHDPGSGLRELDPALSISLVLPWLFGENDVSPAVPFQAPYLGVIPAALAIRAALGIRRSGKVELFLIAATVVLLGLMFGMPPFSWIGRVFPFSLTYNDKYAAPALALGVALLAGAGLGKLSREKTAGLSLVAFGAVIAWMALYVVLGSPPRHYFEPMYAFGLLKPGMIAVSFVAALAGLIVALSRTRAGLSDRAAQWSILGLLLFGLLYDMVGHKPVYHDELPARSARLSKMLSGSGGKFRVHASPELDLIFPNLLLPAGVDDVRYYDPLYPETYVRYMALVNGLADHQVMEHYREHMLFVFERDRLSTPLAWLANTGLYFLATGWEEELLARRAAREAKTVGAERVSWLRAERASLAGREVPALIDHAPASIEFELPADPAPGGGGELRFEAALMRTGRGVSHGDGLVMMGLSGERLLFSRFIAPTRNNPVPVRAPLPDAESVELVLALTPGPWGNEEHDSAAFAMLRRRRPGRPRHIQPVSPEGAIPAVYRDEAASSRARLVRGYAVPPEGEEYFHTVGRVAEVNPKTFSKISVLAKEPEDQARSDQREYLEHEHETAYRGGGRAVISYSRPENGYLVLHDQYLPGWRAWIEREESEEELAIHLADGAFRAVATPAGKGAVRFAYRPVSFAVGTWSAIATLAAGLVTLVALRRRK